MLDFSGAYSVANWCINLTAMQFFCYTPLFQHLMSAQCTGILDNGVLSHQLLMLNRHRSLERRTYVCVYVSLERNVCVCASYMIRIPLLHPAQVKRVREWCFPTPIRVHPIHSNGEGRGEEQFTLIMTWRSWLSHLMRDHTWLILWPAYFRSHLSSGGKFHIWRAARENSHSIKSPGTWVAMANDVAKIIGRAWVSNKGCVRVKDLDSIPDWFCPSRQALIQGR